MYIYIKRLIDIILSLCIIIIIFPILIFIVIIIRLDSEGPVFFKQKRIGINKREFYMIKFRTMVIDAPENIPTHLLNNPYNYITRVGNMLRKTSLDELPQLWNIFVGDMSFIGPRPALWNQYDLIKKRDEYKADLIPVGLTGLAQVNGRDEISLEDKAKLDGIYAKQFGFIMDIKIFCASFRTVLKKDGIKEGKTRKRYYK